MRNNKQIDIELMRILATFFVIFNHTGTEGFFLFSCYDNHSVQYWIYLFISVLCKFSVPVFFMISGALMLDRETASYKSLWQKKIPRMCVILLVWSVFYYLTMVQKGSVELGLQTFVVRFLRHNWNYSFWYLYAYIPFLMSLPILQKIAKSLSNKEYLYLGALVFAFTSLLPVVQYLVSDGRYELNNKFRLDWLCADVFFYPLLGYFLKHRIAEIWNGKRLALLWVINIATILVSCYMTDYRAAMTGELTEANSQAFHSTFVVINSVAVFATCQYLVSRFKIHKYVQNVVISLGGSTFGIYLIHVFWIRYFRQIELLDTIYEVFGMNDMVSNWLFCACVFAVGYVITSVCKRIPIIRRIMS